MSALVIGSTGLVGNQILNVLDKSSSISRIVTIGRKTPKLTSSKLTSILESNSDNWYNIIESQKDINYGISAFGTTRAIAGSAENFVKIDHNINYESAKAAKKAGIDTYVIISSVGANENSRFLYPQTKGKLENDIIDLKFPRTIILRPGALLGERDTSKGFLNALAMGVGHRLYRSKFQLGIYPVKAEEVAQVAVHLAEQPFNKDNKDPQVDIISPSKLLDIAAEINK